MRTRIKICGLTRAEDIAAAANAGADALGFVFYAASARYVTPAHAAHLISLVPPMITTVGLFVNATPQEVAEVVRVAPVAILQFHGDETVEQCIAAAELANRPFLRAVRVRADTNAADLLEYEAQYRIASSQSGGKFAGLLLDAFVEGYGGGGKVFDWSLIPEELAPRVVLSGGLSVQNATDAVLRVRPWAVDISSGVELQKGIKDAAAMHAFIAAVQTADQAINAGQIKFFK